MNTISQIVILLLLSLITCCSNAGREDRDTGKQSIAKSKAMVFYITSEPNEHAFTFLLPENWTVSGGITRVDPNNGGGSGNAIEAKLYMKLISSDQKAGMGWLPDTRFFDMHRYPGQNLAASMFPDGSNYNGMMVMSLPDPATFIRMVAFPFAHPHAQALAIKQVQPLPKLAEEFCHMSAQILGGYSFSYQVAIVTIEYSENGILYLEKMVCAIEDYGKMGGGLWGNKETWYVRSEKPLFESYAPVFATIGHSLKLNTEWLAREICSQQVNSNIALQTQCEVARIDSEIAEHRSRANSEINTNIYLNLTGQEDYTNPFTSEIERGTNEWNYRWENEQGNVIYSDNQNYSPNEDKNIAVKGFKRSEIRRR